MRCYQAISNRYALITFLLFLVPAFWQFECIAAELRLTWADNSADEDGFGIDRKTGLTGTYTTIAIVGPETTTYTDAGLLDDTEYCYRIYAFNSATTSSYSDEACGIALPASSAHIISTAIYTLTVTHSGTGTGTVIGVPSGIDCGSNCSATFISGTAIALIATPDTGSIFAGWSGTGCTTGSLTLTANTTCTATFTPVANAISTNISNGAVLTGTSVLWTAIPSGVPARVEFSIDGVLYWTEFRYIYQFNGNLGTLDSTTLSNGSHELSVRAVYADNSIAEKFITVTVLNSSTQLLAARIGVFRPSTGEWFLDLDGNRAFDGCAIDICVTNFGASGMRPVVGDWYGTGKTNIGVYDPQTGTWHLDDGNGTWDDCESGVDLCIASFGAPGSYPVTKTLSDTDQIVIGFFQRTVTEIVNGTTVTKLGLWKFDIDGNGTLDGCDIDQCIENFGQSGDLPVVGNWDGRGEKIGIFRPQSGEWYLDLNDNGMWDGSPADRIFGPFGQFGDRPVVGNWDGTGVVRIGVFRPSTGQWFLDMNGNGQLDDCSVDTCIGLFGQTGDRPVVGNW
jgi:hypothetical protein